MHGGMALELKADVPTHLKRRPLPRLLRSTSAAERSFPMRSPRRGRLGKAFHDPNVALCAICQLLKGGPVARSVVRRDSLRKVVELDQDHTLVHACFVDLRRHAPNNE